MKKERRLINNNIKSADLVRFKSEGLTPYYFNQEDGENFGLVEIIKPLSGNNRTREVFLLTPEEYKKVNKLVNNIREVIELYKNKISLFKKMVPAIMGELTSK